MAKQVPASWQGAQPSRAQLAAARQPQSTVLPNNSLSLLSFAGETRKLYPPDTQIAVGNNEVMELVNSEGAIWNESGHLLKGPFDLEHFLLGSTPPSGSDGLIYSDPRLVYDASTGHWFASANAYCPTFFSGTDCSWNGTTVGSLLFIGASANADPSGTWYFVHSNAGYSTGLFFSAPRLGYSTDKIGLATDDFTNTGAFSLEDSFVFIKSEILTGTFVNYAALSSTSPLGGAYGMVPAQGQGSGGRLFFTYNDSDPALVEDQGSPKLGLINVSGLPNAVGFAVTTSWITMTATSAPPLATQPGDSSDVNDACLSSCIDTGSDTFITAVWANGSLWTAGNEACNWFGIDTTNRSCGRLEGVDTTGGTILTEQDIAFYGQNFFYPSLTIDGGGDVFGTVSLADDYWTEFPSLYGFEVRACDLSTYWDPIFVSTHSTTQARWGDYNSAATDPAVPSDVWLGGQYASNTDGTWVTGVTLAPSAFPVASGMRPYTGGHDAIGVPNASTDAYFAEGYTGPNFDEYLTLANPNATETVVCADYLLATGDVIRRTYALPANSRTTLLANTEVGPNQSVAVHFHSSGTFVAERPMYFDYGSGWTGGHDAVGASALANTFYFAEGYTGSGFQEYLTLMNPNGSTAIVDVTYYLANGTTKTVTKNVAATSRLTVNVNDPTEGVGAGQNVSIKVTNHSGNTVTFLAERPMYFNYQGKWTGGHDVIGSTALQTTLNLAEGYVAPNQFDEYLTILNPNSSDAHLTITYECQGSTAPHCGVAGQVMQTVTANSRGTRLVNADFPGLAVSQSIHITSDQPVMVERPMYFNYQGVWSGGHDAIAVPNSYLGTSFNFAEGYVASNFSEYLTILNNTANTANITITYLLVGGGTLTKQMQVAANSRGTRHVNDDFPSQAVSQSVQILSDQPVLVERPMYFSY